MDTGESRGGLNRCASTVMTPEGGTRFPVVCIRTDYARSNHSGSRSSPQNRQVAPYQLTM
ncbi:hypothetical protein SSCG_04075 [Streptomyces clavuligerus]|nr:hypothetical protein SSCG_04075 [Streptomyces clavuligerus]